ncbi:DHHA1 domain-containing protein [Streptomyces sp. NPDC057623]|uniref:DHHA1 domain-containing protein n=1 Tax=Streptomyces sp. NPDC057623 TaxID=3346187 RepID=UPI0036909773
MTSPRASLYAGWPTAEWALPARERDLVTRIAEQLQAPRAELPDRIATLLDRLRAADRENHRLRQQAVQARARELAARAQDVDGVRVATATAEGGADAARALAVAVRDLLPAERPGVATIGSESGGGKAVVVTAVNSAARTAGQDASTLVKRVLHSRGGGSPEVAQESGLPTGQLAKTPATVPGLLGGA